MVPVIALVGRPNVGKSTLFNRFTRSRDALVADWEGLTRDRKYGEGQLSGQSFIVIDTGGISGLEQGLDAEMANQSYQAIDQADIVLFIVDAKAGVTSADQYLADYLRKTIKPVTLVVNKTDGLDPQLAGLEFFELGLGDPFMIAAGHNRGVLSLLEATLTQSVEGFNAANIPLERSEETEDESIRLAVIGRPNVGKSTLVNRMLGEERVVVYDHPGTTMDSIYIPYERNGQSYTLIDTAGIRRRKNITQSVEKFSIVKTLQAIQDANMVVVVIDAQEGLVDQDMHLLGFALDAGRSIVFAINKWDGLSEDQKNKVKVALDRRIHFLDWIDRHLISAKHGTNVGHLYKSIEQAYQGAKAHWSTNQLTSLLQNIVEMHQPPMVGHRRIKMRYAHQGGSNPPIIVIYGNQLKKLPASYRRYLENSFRKALGVRGTPIKIEFRTGKNPFDSKVDHVKKTTSKKSNK